LGSSNVIGVVEFQVRCFILDHNTKLLKMHFPDRSVIICSCVVGCERFEVCATFDEHIKLLVCFTKFTIADFIGSASFKSSDSSRKFNMVSMLLIVMCLDKNNECIIYVLGFCGGTPAWLSATSWFNG